MKRILLLIPVLAAVIATSSCRKDTLDNTPVVSNLLSERATVQVYNGTLNSNRNFVYVNGSPANGATIAFGAAFPATANSFLLYNGDNLVTIKDTLSTSTQVAQSFILPAKAGKSYSIFTYDTITTPKRLVVENNFEYLEGKETRLRFVNLIYNPTAVPNVDLYSVNANAILFSNVAVGQITPFIPVTPNFTDTWQVRQTGTTTVLATLAVTSANINPTRHYTVVYRGSHRASANRAINIIATK